MLLRRPHIAFGCLAALVAGGCSAPSSALDGASPGAERIAGLSWVVFVTATAVTTLVFALLAVGLLRRRRPERDRRSTERWIIAGGLVLPVLVITPVAALSVSILDQRSDAPPDDALVVEVVGHQFWWEYRYPELGVETANELHLPVGRTVTLRLRSDDVIHSWWVPELEGKSDLVPGHTNELMFRADEPGIYRGQCAEFCGIQHAKMRLLVVVEPEDRFERWVAHEREPATLDGPAEGRRVFFAGGCASCHTVRGTDADGVLGPDLTHVASRRMLAANTIPNDPASLRRWIADTWDVKDHVIMPPVPLDPEDVDAVARYLESLR